MGIRLNARLFLTLLRTVDRLLLDLARYCCSSHARSGRAGALERTA